MVTGIAPALDSTHRRALLVQELTVVVVIVEEAAAVFFEHFVVLLHETERNTRVCRRRGDTSKDRLGI